ncbi:MAG: hypothetical protein JO332_03630, partial [Planctomycetaceae bacterium]|nr:hypothetical protein [Planctomycetaceae bacterium]
RPDAGPLGLLGHGEGGLAACVLAAKDPGVKSVILLAPPSTTLDEILLLRAERALREQGTRDDALKEMLGQQRKLFESIKASKEDYLEIDERRTFVGWMRERFTLDPRVALAKVSQPALLCVGSKDRELPPAQVESLKLARTGLDARSFEGLDHVFAGPEGRVDPAFLKYLAERVPQTVK